MGRPVLRYKVTRTATTPLPEAPGRESGKSLILWVPSTAFEPLDSSPRARSEATTDGFLLVERSDMIFGSHRANCRWELFSSRTCPYASLYRFLDQPPRQLGKRQGKPNDQYRLGQRGQPSGPHGQREAPQVDGVRSSTQPTHGAQSDPDGGTCATTEHTQDDRGRGKGDYQHSTVARKPAVFVESSTGHCQR